MWHWTRTPDPAWQLELARLAPRRDHVSHLTIRWVPMHNRQAAQRWVVFECVPIAYVAHIGHLMDHLWNPLSEDPTVWWAREYVEQTGCVPMPFWVCQGNAMGHPHAYNAMEKAQSAAGQLPSRPPYIGQLAYSEPSDLTWEAIRRRSNLNRRIADAYRQLELDREQAQRSLRAGIAADVEASMAEVMAEHGKDLYEQHAKPVETSARSKANATDEDFSQYIETGSLPLPNSQRNP